MSDNKITTYLDLDPSEYNKELKLAEKRARKSGDTSGVSFGKNFGKSVKAVAIGNLLADAIQSSVKQIAGTIKGVVNEASKLEVFEVQFANLLKSTTLAKKQLEDLRDFASTTPFQLDGLALATRQLLSFGIEQDQVMKKLRLLGDLSAGTGSNIDELTIPYGRLISTQRLSLIELDKFADRGINLYKKLSDQTGVSLKIIRDEISKGRIPFQEFEKALKDFTSQGGEYFRATQKQSETTAGRISTLSDVYKELQATWGEALSPAFKLALVEVTDLLRDSIKFAKSNKERIEGFALSITSKVMPVLEDVVKLINKITGVTIDTIVGPSATKEMQEVEERIRGLKSEQEELSKAENQRGLNNKINAEIRIKQIKREIEELDKLRASLAPSADIKQNFVLQSTGSDITDLDKLTALPSDSKVKVPLALEMDTQTVVDAGKSIASARADIFANLKTAGVQSNAEILKQRDQRLAIIRQANEAGLMSDSEYFRRKEDIERSSAEKLKFEEDSRKFESIAQAEQARENELENLAISRESDIISLEAFRQREAEVNAKYDSIISKQEADNGKRRANTARRISDSIGSSMVNGVSQGIQKLITNMKSGQNAFEGFGKFIMNTMGDMAINVGTITLATGIGLKSFGDLTGSSAIIAGIGLIAAGATIKAFAGSGTSGAGGVDSGGSGFGSSIGGGSNFEETQVEEEGRSPDTNVSVNIQGDVLDSEESGMRIVNILNDAFDKQGVVLT